MQPFLYHESLSSSAMSDRWTSRRRRTPLRARFAQPAVVAMIIVMIAPMPASAQCLLCSAETSALVQPITDDRRALPLRIEVIADLDFSRLVAGRGGGSVRIDPDGGGSAVGRVAPIGGYGFSGRVMVSGTPGRTVRIGLPAEVMLTASSGHIVRVTDISANLPPLARLGPDGRLEFAFGGRLDLDGEAYGDYRGRIDVTVSYE